jgi:hypothetical protein
MHVIDRAELCFTCQELIMKGCIYKLPMSSLSKKLGRIHNIFKAELDRNICSEKEFFVIIERERERANRNNHKFSLILLDLRLSGEDQKATMLFLKKIIRRIRKIDEIGWYAPRRLGIVLPYTPSEGAQEFADSISALPDSASTVASCTIYTYPYENATGSKKIR